MMARGVFQNTRKILYNFKHNKLVAICIRQQSTVPQAVLLERNLINEEICVPRTGAAFTTDMIGPPHTVSNLRPIIWYRSSNETNLQRRLLDLQEATQKWNQHFWEAHNLRFIQERKMYMDKNLPADGTKQTLTADEMSGFYKEFLDKNWLNHATYNFEWYKKNFRILFLAIAVHIERFIL